MSTKENKTTCSNCKYFKRHYVVSATGLFSAIGTGHCANADIKRNLSDKHTLKNEGCDLWQPYELQKLRVQYGIEQYLIRISETIDNILAVLRDAE